jgi:hypothetical protein
VKRIDIPETITDEQMSDLQRRAQLAHGGESWFSTEAVARRLASIDQREKRDLS